MNAAVVAIKILRASITVVLLVAFVFVILRLSGDPAVQMLGLEVSQQALDEFRHRWGLDRPIWEQFLSFFWNFLHGDLASRSLVAGTLWGLCSSACPKRSG